MSKFSSGPPPFPPEVLAQISRDSAPPPSIKAEIQEAQDGPPESRDRDAETMVPCPVCGKGLCTPSVAAEYTRLRRSSMPGPLE